MRKEIAILVTAVALQPRHVLGRASRRHPLNLNPPRLPATLRLLLLLL